MTPMKATVIIMCGIPTSGKSTWAKAYQQMQYYPGDDFRSFRIMSRDALRESIYGKDYKPSSDKEKYITEVYNKIMNDCIRLKKPMILDNTHCKESYLKEALKRFEGTDYSVKIKFFDLPLWKAFVRNHKRKWQTGKFIPWNVIKAMKKNYDKINQTDYAKYLLERTPVCGRKIYG
jgi:predicted kinase